jgi:hypothetical protein
MNHTADPAPLSEVEAMLGAVLVLSIVGIAATVIIAILGSLA